MPGYRSVYSALPPPLSSTQSLSCRALQDPKLTARSFRGACRSTKSSLTTTIPDFKAPAPLPQYASLASNSGSPTDAHASRAWFGLDPLLARSVVDA